MLVFSIILLVLLLVTGLVNLFTVKMYYNDCCYASACIGSFIGGMCISGFLFAVLYLTGG